MIKTNYNPHNRNYKSYSTEYNGEAPLIVKAIFGLVIGLLIIVLLIFNSMTNSNNSKLITEFKEGTATLSCLIGPTYKDIDPKMIVKREDSRWIFTNGSAKNCIIKR